MHRVPGIRLGAAASDCPDGKENIAIIEIAANSNVAAIFTQNAFAAPPVKLAKEHLRQQPGGKRYCLINSGNANAATGGQGYEDCLELCQSLAAITGCTAEAVLPFSTGIIGRRLAVKQLAAALPAAVNELSEDGWERAAEAIMTTDKFSKAASSTWQNSKGRTMTASAIAKGAGMICPDMATMLAFICCDESMGQGQLQGMLEIAVAGSFNRISVDGDTSTNDAVALIATGSGETANDEDLALCQQHVTQLCQQLAHAIVSDGEGASKVVEIHVHGAASKEEGSMVARAIAHSPLVKTAFFGCDPNWGRIMAAAGRAGIPDLEEKDFCLSINSTKVVTNGVADAGLDHAALARQLRDCGHIRLEMELGRGNASDYVITCDLGHDYVSLNSEYST